MKNLKVHMALILVSLLFGVNFVMNKIVLHAVSPGAWAFGRIFLTALFMFFIVFVILKNPFPTGRQWMAIGFLGFFGVVVNQIAFFEGLARTTATHAAIINTSIPVFVLFFSLISGQEKPEWHRILGMAMGVIGVLIVIEVEKQHFDSALFLGDFLNLVNSVSFAFYLYRARTLNRQMNPLVVTTGMFMIGAVGAAAYGGKSIGEVPWTHLPWVVYGCQCGNLLPQ
jgi:drug/metabolite transporter (DMT)-like permease